MLPIKTKAFIISHENCNRRQCPPSLVNTENFTNTRYPCSYKKSTSGPMADSAHAYQQVPKQPRSHLLSSPQWNCRTLQESTRTCSKTGLVMQWKSRDRDQLCTPETSPRVQHEQEEQLQSRHFLSDSLVRLYPPGLWGLLQRHHGFPLVSRPGRVQRKGASGRCLDKTSLIGDHRGLAHLL